MQKIDIQTKQRNHFITLFTPENMPDDAKLPCVILARGWPSNSQEEWTDYGQRLADSMNAVTVLFNYSGQGTNTPVPLNELKLSDSLDDLKSVFDTALAQPMVDDSLMFVLGNSFSAHITAELTASRNIKGISLRCPAIYSDEMQKMSLDKLGVREKNYYKTAVENADSNPAFISLRNYKGNVQIIEHSNDEEIPKFLVNEFVKSSSGAKSLTYNEISDASHTLTKQSWREQNELLLTKWLRSIVEPTR